ncbi:MAG TPA: hypothetical protein VFP56_03190 [Candidatus Limnocylindrales bacterium]|nr:hypothetical protein [Candidatus Limnocylindrales bacterium]
MIDRFGRLLNGVSFHRGLALGALVGAAIAGSTLWARVRGARDRAQAAGRLAGVTDPKDRVSAH